MTFLLRLILPLALILTLTVGFDVQSSNAHDLAKAEVADNPVELAVNATNTKTFFLADGAIAVEVPERWRPNPKDNPFEEQYIARKQFLGSGFRVLRKDKLPAEIMPRDTFLKEIEEVTDPLEGAVDLVEYETVENLSDKRITSTTYETKLGSLMTVYYKFALIEFSEDSNFFLLSIQGGAAKDWDQANETLMNINRSATLVTTTS